MIGKLKVCNECEKRAATIMTRVTSRTGTGEPGHICDSDECIERWAYIILALAGMAFMAEHGEPRQVLAAMDTVKAWDKTGEVKAHAGDVTLTLTTIK